VDARFLFVPVAAATIMLPAQAAVYLSVEQAQALMFPGADFSPDFRTLTAAQSAAIEKASGTNVLNKQVRLWKVSTGGWFIADEVVGKHDFIPFALGIDANGIVTDVEILEYREAYGGDVRNPKWRAQFVGKSRASPLKLTTDIENISGATLSSKHITDGVRRLLTTYAVLLANI
jgi:Na+-translocating ferredoxin:NAD+ oxidoreductase RnfG subunit